MNNDIVCELLEAKDDTKDNVVSDRLNRIESLILYVLKEKKKTKVSSIQAPNSTGANSTVSDLIRSEALQFSGFPFQVSGSTTVAPNSTEKVSPAIKTSVARSSVPLMDISTAPKVSMGALKSTLPGSVMTSSVSASTSTSSTSTPTPSSGSLELILKDYKEITDTFSTSTTEESSLSTNSLTSVSGCCPGFRIPAVPKKSNKEVNHSAVFSSKKSVNSQSEPLSFNSQLSVVEKSIYNSMPLLKALRDTPSTSSAPNIEEELTTHFSDTSAKKSINVKVLGAVIKSTRAKATCSTGSHFNTGYFQTSKEVVKLPLYSSLHEDTTGKFKMSPTSTAL